MAQQISTVGERERLKARRAPHWAKISTGAYIGYRKMTPTGDGAWLLRHRSKDLEGHYQQHQVSLGDLADVPKHQRYALAVEKARELLADHERESLIKRQGASMEVITVADACAFYVQQTEKAKGAKGAKAASDIKRRLNAYVLNNAALANTPLKKLNARQIDAWLDGIKSAPNTSGPNRGQPRTPSTLNRDMTCFRAALNHAFKEGYIPTALPWAKALKPIPRADKRRQVILSRDELSRFIVAAEQDTGLFIKALALVPLRPGAMAALTVGDLNIRDCTLHIPKDKADEGRTLHLPQKTISFFAEQARNKLPSAPLIARADGAHWDKDAWKKPVKRAALAARLFVTIAANGKEQSAVTIYAVRHTAITTLLHSGLDALTTAQIAGTSVRMIELNYGHLTKQHSIAALEKLAF